LERSAANRVTIIIVTYNSMPALGDCLTSLDYGGEGVDWALVVVDNGSDDGSLDCVGNIRPGATIIENKRNEGFAAACNRGAREADGDFLLFLNPDVILDKYAIKRLLEAATTNIRVGALGGRLRNADDSFQPTCRRYPSVGNVLFSRGSVLGRWFGSSTRYTLPDYETTTAVPAIAGTMLMIRRSLFERIEGFDPRFFMYLEDTDLCWRVKQAGYKNIFVPAAGGVHLWRQGSRVGGIRRAVQHHSSMWKYFLKHLPNGFSLIVLPVLLVANLIATILSLNVRSLFSRSGEKKR